MLLLLLSFLAGALTVLAPCVLPFLPVIIGGSLQNPLQNKRPYLIALSLSASLILFTYLLKVTSTLSHLPPRFWSLLSALILALLGVLSLFPNLYDHLIAKTNLQKNSDQILKRTLTKNNALGAIFTGAALGPLFSSCSPTYAFILATVLPKSDTLGFIYLISYSLGLSLVLLAISLTGRKYLKKFSWAIDTHSTFRRSLAILFILVALAVGFGWDKKFELYSNAHLPTYLSKIDAGLLNLNSKTSPTKKIPATQPDFNVTPYKAPAIAGIYSWINSAPLSVNQLKGHVVLVDFWTYSCINCIRTLSYVEKWYQTYHKYGLEVIGISAPEFSFEKIPSNVAAAAKEYHLTYPIALDNSLTTWGNYQNQYWPAHYLINTNGEVVSTHFGEGDYAQTEKTIQSLLHLNKNLISIPAPNTFNPLQTPETYFGSARESGFIGPNYHLGLGSYIDHNFNDEDSWDLGGTWSIQEDSIIAVKDSTLRFNLTAKNVYLVASASDNKPYPLTVSIDGKKPQTIIIRGSNLYPIADFGTFGYHTLLLHLPPMLSLHTFTFGS